MSLFSKIWDRIRGHKADAAPAAPRPSPSQPSPTTSSPATALPSVDVEAILEAKAAEKGAAAGNWRTSIVDLLKLLDLDSSLEARKELADELGVNAGPHGSAEQNIALSKAVWRKLAENGGQAPASLRD